MEMGQTCLEGGTLGGRAVFGNTLCLSAGGTLLPQHTAAPAFLALRWLRNHRLPPSHHSPPRLLPPSARHNRRAYLTCAGAPAMPLSSLPTCPSASAPLPLTTTRIPSRTADVLPCLPLLTYCTQIPAAPPPRLPFTLSWACTLAPSGRPLLLPARRASVGLGGHPYRGAPLQRRHRAHHLRIPHAAPRANSDAAYVTRARRCASPERARSRDDSPRYGITRPPRAPGIPTRARHIWDQPLRNCSSSHTITTRAHLHATQHACQRAPERLLPYCFTAMAAALT